MSQSTNFNVFVSSLPQESGKHRQEFFKHTFPNPGIFKQMDFSGYLLASHKITSSLANYFHTSCIYSPQRSLAKC